MRHLLCLLIGLTVLPVACSQEQEPHALDVPAGPVALRRLTADQYRRSVRDVLGLDLKLGGQLEPDHRRDGLIAVGSSYVTVTPTGLDQYEAMAYRAAAQAVDPEHRQQNVLCAPASPDQPHDACSRETVARLGRLLFRRPLTSEELDSRVAIAQAAAQTLGDFYAGLEFALASLLTSPHFLFRVAALDEAPGTARLSDMALATRLSYALWSSAPDEELLAAAERGELTTAAGLSAAVERMVASPRLSAGVRSFFSDVFRFAEFDDGFRKDGAIFPAYAQGLIDDAREQTLLTVEDHVTAGRDYRQLFTTRRTFLSRALGALYGLPLPLDGEFSAVELPADHPRAGLLTHASLLALHSHPGRSSATLRGAFVRAAMLCQDIPPPPGDVDFSVVEQPDEDLPTLRDKVAAHVSDPGCSGCHMLTDPIGLALEQFDGLGRFRTTENGVVIDPSGELDGAPFLDAVGLGEAVAGHNRLVPCLVRQLFMTVVGRKPTPEEWDELDRLETVFIDSGYNTVALWAAIFGSPAVRWSQGPLEVTP